MQRLGRPLEVEVQAEHTCRVVGKGRERVEEANDGRGLESPGLGSELQPCQMVVVEEVPEDRQAEDMLIANRAVVGYMELVVATEEKRQDNWMTVAVANRLTEDVLMKDAIGFDWCCC